MKFSFSLSLKLGIIMLSLNIAPIAQATSYSDNTYLKCVYKLNNETLDARSGEIWESDNDGNWITVPGRWHNPSPLARISTFFTPVSQKELKQRCVNAVKKAGIDSPIVLPYAANNYASADNMFWSAEQAEDQNKTIDRMIIFGDSLTDSVNLFNDTFGLGPNSMAWFHGRATNGLIWYEYLSELTDLPAYSWAYAGAMAEDKDFVIPVPVSDLVTPGIAKQVDQYITASRDSQNHDPAKAMSVLFFGGNDAVFNVSTPEHVIEVLKENIDKLIAAGGKNFVIINLPDISLTQIVQKEGEENIARVKVFVETYNQLLDELVQEYNTNTSDDYHFIAPDIKSLFEEATATPEKFGLTNTIDSCLVMTDFTQTINELPVSEGCQKANGTYMYWDIVHPTTQVYKLMASKIKEQIMPQCKWFD